MAELTPVTLDANGLAVAPGMIMVYSFDAASGLYTGSGEEFLPQGVGIPAHSTVIAPPDADAGNVCIFQAGHWQQVVDHRGETVYCTETGATVRIMLPGDYPEGTTTRQPLSEFDKWDGSAWVTDTDAQHAAHVSTATRQKSTLLTHAQATISLWQTELQLGTLSEADKASLMQWMQYIKALNAVDVSMAPDIDWPDTPA